MKIYYIRCVNCDQNIGVKDKHAGKTLRCAKCKSKNKIPENLSEQTGIKTKRRIEARCERCNLKLAVPERKLHQEVECPRCAERTYLQPIQKPEAPAAPVQLKGDPLPLARPSKTTASKTPKRSKPSKSILNKPTLIVASVFVVSLLVLCGSLYWIFVEGESTQTSGRDDSARTESSSQKALEDSAEKVATTQPKLTPSEPVYKPGRNHELFGYEFEIKLTHNGHTETVLGANLCEPLPPNSTQKSDHQRRKLPSEERAMGIGIPGHRILAPFSHVEGANKIEVEVDGKLFTATVLRNDPSLGVSVLDFQGRDFSALPISQFIEPGEPIHLIQESELGEINLASHQEIASQALQLRPANPSTVKPGLPSIAFTDWGTFAGLVSNDRRLIPIAELNRLLKNDNKVFRNQSTHQLTPLRKTLQQLSPNLVPIRIERDYSKNTVPLAQFHTFCTPSNFTSGKYVRWKFRPAILRNYFGNAGFIVSDYNIRDTLPGFVGPPHLIGFEPIQPNKRRWSNQQFVSIDTTDGIKYLSCPESVWNKKKKNRATLHQEFEVVDTNANILHILKKIRLENASDIGFGMEAEKRIEFDIDSGRILNSDFRGVIHCNLENWSGDIDVDMKVRLLTPAQAQTIKLEYLASDPKPGTVLQYSEQPTIPLADIQVDSVIAQLSDSDYMTRRTALIKLLSVIPEPNEQISAALVDLFPEKIPAGNGQVGLSLAAARRWILRKDLPRLVERLENAVATTSSVSEFYREKAFLVFDLLTIHPPIDPMLHDRLKKLFQLESRTNNQLANLIHSKYPEMAESIYLDALLKNKPIPFDTIVSMLHQHGTHQSIPPLQKHLRKYRNEEKRPVRHTEPVLRYISELEAAIKSIQSRSN